jgi:DNA polymerase-3 subunit delta'
VTLHPLRGHEAVRASLVRAHGAGVLPSALLLHGARGVGKQHLALWLARLLVCMGPEDGPCDCCGPCRMALALEHPDIHWYFPLPRPKGVSADRMPDALEQARHEELAEIRSNSVRPSWTEDVRAIYLGTVTNLRAVAAKRPNMAEGPVFIVGQAEALVPQESSQEAANALLKLLEEPPGAARFILTSSEPGLLLPTIRSRTVPLHVPPLTFEDVHAFLSEHASADDRTAAWAARLGQGSPGRAVAFLPDDGEPGPLEQLRRRAYEIVVAAMGAGPGDGYEVAISFPPAGARSFVELFTFVEEWLRDLAAVAAGAGDAVFNQDARARLEKHLADTGAPAVDVAEAFSSVERARALARGNVNPQLVVAALIRDLRPAFRRGTPLAGAVR